MRVFKMVMLVSKGGKRKRADRQRERAHGKRQGGGKGG
jgi:hypothetical protein